MPNIHIKYYTEKTNSDGTHPVILYIQRKKRTLANVFKHQWDEEKKRVIPKTHPNYAVINIKISNEYNRIESLILSNKFDLKRDFLDYFDGLNKKIKEPEKPEAAAIKSFKEVCKLYVSSLKSGSSMITYENRLNKFLEVSGIGDLPTSAITTEHVKNFVNSYIGKKDSSIRTNLKIIRFASSFAAREKYDKKSSDLHEYKLPKAKRSFKAKLNKSELVEFSAVEPASDVLKEYKDIFMLGYYCRGMRIGDLLTLKQKYIINGRLVYESNKNEKHFNINLVPQAKEIVDRYLDGREYLFTFYKWKANPLWSVEENMKDEANHIKTIVSRINKGLKDLIGKTDIKKNISTHMGRHTFAKMASMVAKGNLNLSMDLLGHSDLKEHQIYMLEISKDDELDDAADKIFS